MRRCLRSEGRGTGAERSFFCWLPKPDGCAGGHHKPKCAINIDSDCWQCFVCGQGGRNLLRLLALGGRDHEDYIDYAAEVASAGAPKQVERAYEPVRLPAEFWPLCVPRNTLGYRQAMGYLECRGATADDILTYKLGYCEGGSYAERVVVPSFDRCGELDFWTARAIWKRVSPPYLHGRFDKDIVFNDLLIDWTEPVTLVEGPFDAIRAGTQAIPLQGKALRPKLLKELMEAKVPVRVALDGDAFDASMRVLAELLACGVDASYIDLGGKKDPGEMEQGELERCASFPVRDAADILRLRAMNSGTRAR